MSIHATSNWITDSGYGYFSLSNNPTHDSNNQYEKKLRQRLIFTNVLNALGIFPVIGLVVAVARGVFVNVRLNAAFKEENKLLLQEIERLENEAETATNQEELKQKYEHLQEAKKNFNYSVKKYQDVRAVVEAFGFGIVFLFIDIGVTIARKKQADKLEGFGAQRGTILIRNNPYQS
ncbi:MAG: hypothetical protein BGO10_02345 [Chlamydia sp. 32-24]|nr:MAG: hypothetical protein BGO10_02345 [Chlamydia sp. 32-24]